MNKEISASRQLTGGGVLNNRRINKSNSTFALGIRVFHEKQRPFVCREHINFGFIAKNCKKWCTTKSPNLPLIHNSRSSCPAPSNSESS